VVDYPEIEIYALNEEHAFLRTEGIIPLQIGQKISVVPNHACVVTNLTEKVYGFRNGQLERTIDIDARAKSV
jgi:D-serine deaminase-like pyridoxal phosphate-dependent protein